jgi:hypothetical protein
MADFHPRLLEATTPAARMDALCEFIAFWLGERQPAYGETAESLAERSLPMPLKRLYEFAGRWPHWDREGSSNYVVPVFSHQDNLAALDRLKYEADGKVVFLHENQDVWDCRTLANGDDPPVWCHGDHMDESENWFRGEKLVCNSLSHFLVTFVLQELSLGARFKICDEGLSLRFTAERGSAVPVWTGGCYVHENPHDYHLWGDVLVAELWGARFFAANRASGIQFLTENQGPIIAIRLMMGLPWTLELQSDGSARVEFSKGKVKESAEARHATFAFADLVAKLSTAASDEGHHEQNATMFFFRKGQSGGIQGKHLHDRKLVTSLFRLVLERSADTHPALEQRLVAEEKRSQPL